MQKEIFYIQHRYGPAGVMHWSIFEKRILTPKMGIMVEKGLKVKVVKLGQNLEPVYFWGREFKNEVKF